MESKKIVKMTRTEVSEIVKAIGTSKGMNWNKFTTG